MSRFIFINHKYKKWVLAGLARTYTSYIIEHFKTEYPASNSFDRRYLGS